MEMDSADGGKFWARVANLNNFKIFQHRLSLSLALCFLFLATLVVWLLCLGTLLTLSHFYSLTITSNL